MSIFLGMFLLQSVYDLGFFSLFQTWQSYIIFPGGNQHFRQSL